jgi:hypothetical protein
MPTSGPRLKLEIEGANLAEDMLFGIVDRSHDMKPVLKVIRELMRKNAEAQFVTEGTRGGRRWELDKPNTIAKKIAAGYPNKTEIMTSDLYVSLTQRAGGGDAIRRISRHSTTFGTRRFYAIFQGHKRQLLEFTTMDADDWAQRMVAYCLEGAL